MNADGKSNAFDGQATHVVQAGTIYGGVNNGQNSLPAPRQLPRAATCFTDRADPMAQLSELAMAENEIVLISGPAGVGKSALAVFWAHSVKQQFPDGQLYVNLRGYDRLAPLPPEEVLHGFLSALGMPADRMPGDLSAMSALFRSLIDGKRLLLVADNAGSSDQVRPLLPASPVCFTVVTSRNRLSSLTAVDGATHLPVRPLDTPHAVELFSRLSGHRDTDGATQLVLRCGRLPLTVRMAARLASSDASLMTLLEELTSGNDRLEALSALDEELEVRSVFSWSYEQLPPATARAFRLLSLHAGPDFSVPAAAALTGLSETDTLRVLRRLTAVNMLEETGERRYAYHDLLRDYAREQAAAEESRQDRAHALKRELSFYLRMADAADRVLVPERQHVPLDRGGYQGKALFTDPAAALRWCDAELSSLVPAVQQAVELGLDEVAWKLPVALVYFLRSRRHNIYRLELSTTAVEASRRLRDRWAEAWSLICLGGAESDLERHEDALVHFTEALRVSQDINDRRWEARSTYNVAWTLRLMGRYEEALHRQREALVIRQETGDRRGESISLSEIGALELNLGRPAQAYAEYERALVAARETVDLSAEAKSLHGLGDVCKTQGHTSDAIGWYEQAVLVRRRVGDMPGLARSLVALGRLLAAVGRAAVAQEALVEAAEVLDTLHDPTAEDVRRFLAGHFGQAKENPREPRSDTDG
ncbi:tetratricopeptide repeat protein [Streptomyces sp. NPDC005303]|uniref:ATP-binding protein n=1 Tax=Streptomyces sp. NPDC005303 TaxID=3155713 RepID=UPI0033BBA1FB